MKIIFKIHPFFYLFACICVFTGYFKNFLMITFIILFHELGHILTSLFFKWQIDRVVILPFGGLTLFNEKINRPIVEEFLIAIMGPIFQIFLLSIDNELFKTYCINLLVFNLLPIFPLDGSKILNLILNKVFSFKESHLISIVISIFSIMFLLKFKFNLILYIAIFFLIVKTYKELKMHNFLFHKFLFERYLYKFHFKKSKIVNKTSKMKRDYRHLIKDNDRYITEVEYLKRLFR